MECGKRCRYCTNYKCRCEDCFAVTEESGRWYCDEYGDFCENITECDEYEDRPEEDTAYFEALQTGVFDIMGATI